MLPPTLPTWLSNQLPADTRRRMVPVGGGRHLHLMETGALPGEGRPVLLVHGNPTWGFLYRKVMAELADDGVHLLAPDLLGLGFSDRIAAAEHTLPTHGQALVDLIEHLDLTDILLVIQDWGGPIGLWALAQVPDRITGLVVMNTVTGPPRPGFKATAFHRFSQMPVISDIAFRLLGYPQRALHQAQGDPASIQGEVARAYRWPLRGVTRNTAPLALARLVPDSLEHPSVAPLGECQTAASAFTGPCAVVWGNKDPVLGRARKRVVAGLSNPKVWQTDAGHFLQEEVPDTIAQAIRWVHAGGHSGDKAETKPTGGPC